MAYCLVSRNLKCTTFAGRVATELTSHVSLWKKTSFYPFYCPWYSQPQTVWRYHWHTALIILLFFCVSNSGRKNNKRGATIHWSHSMSRRSEWVEDCSPHHSSFLALQISLQTPLSAWQVSNKEKSVIASLFFQVSYIPEIFTFVWHMATLHIHTWR